jgi:hypothetical protein
MHSMEYLYESRDKHPDIWGKNSKRFQNAALKQGSIKFVDFKGYWKK